MFWKANSDSVRRLTLITSCVAEERTLSRVAPTLSPSLIEEPAAQDRTLDSSPEMESLVDISAVHRNDIHEVQQVCNRTCYRSKKEGKSLSHLEVIKKPYPETFRIFRVRLCSGRLEIIRKYREPYENPPLLRVLGKFLPRLLGRFSDHIWSCALTDWVCLC